MLTSLLPMPLKPDSEDEDERPAPSAPSAPPAPPPDRSPAVRAVIDLFGLPDDAPAAVPGRYSGVLPDAAPDPAPPAAGQVMLLTGASGAGKSTLLRRLVASVPAGTEAIDVARVRLRQAACVDQFGRRSAIQRADPRRLAFALDLLSRVGLAEAHTYLRPPEQLSDGQRWRLRLAVALSRCMAAHNRAASRGGLPPATLLVADEFAAVLDRVSAAVVARSLRRTVDRLARVGVRLCALVATSHDDLGPALLPDVTVRCDFGATTVARLRRE